MPMPRIPALSLLLAVFCLLPRSSSASLAPKEIAARLQQVYDATTTLEARFSQKTSLKNSSRSREGSGRLVIAKPGRIRWDYERPGRQVIVCRKDMILMYFAASRQLVKSRAADYLKNDITTSFLMGRGRIADDFTVSANPVEDSRYPYALRLTPRKPHPQVKRIDLWLGADFLVRRIVLLDHFGSLTEITLSDLEVNRPVEDALFSFTPPEGTEIVDNTRLQQKP